MSNTDIWNPEIWKRINGAPAQNGKPAEPGALKEQMGLIRIAQRVFDTKIRGNDEAIPADTIDLKTGTPSDGERKTMATVTKTFELNQIHIDDPELTTAMNQVMLVAQGLALAEDALFFQGADAPLPEDIEVSNGAKLGKGLLGIAESDPKRTIQVPRAKSGSTELSVYGAATLAAVAKAIQKFQGIQAPPFALILDPISFADVVTPVTGSFLVAPIQAIKELLGHDTHVVMSQSLPEFTGLFAALGGKTTQLYVGTGPEVRLDTESKGRYLFTAKETIQFHNIDSRSLIKLDFEKPTA